MKTLFNFSILALIWSIYYLAMHITGDILTAADVIICGIVIFACIVIIIHYLYAHKFKSKNHNH